MSQLTYSEKLKDPRWQQMRLRLFERDKWTCKECGLQSKTLNVHHGYYAFKTEPWEYPQETLHTVCEGCHKYYEEVKALLYFELAKLSISGLQETLKNVLKPKVEISSPEKDAEDIKKWIAVTGPNLHQLKKYMDNKYPTASLDFKSNFYQFAKREVKNG